MHELLLIDLAKHCSLLGLILKILTMVLETSWMNETMSTTTRRSEEEEVVVVVQTPLLFFHTRVDGYLHMRFVGLYANDEFPKRRHWQRL